MTQKKLSLFGGSFTVAALLQTRSEKILSGGLCFTLNKQSVQNIKVKFSAPILHVPIERLDARDAVCECWYSSGTSKTEIAGDINYKEDDDILFGTLHINESFFTSSKNKTALQLATESAYAQIFTLLEQKRYPHIFRFWNYMADINAESNGLERYRQFNLGRHTAFKAFNREIIGNAPAACALGFKHINRNNTVEDRCLSIAFIAGCVPAKAIENPRQISAYQYPEKYGPVSPTFSRASLIKLLDSELLLISGTASIVGHATQHASDVITQTREAMTNIQAILDQANRHALKAKFSLEDLHYRVYVRHKEHMPNIQHTMNCFIGKMPIAEYYQADICRKDLLLEIEASVECFDETAPEMKG